MGAVRATEIIYDGGDDGALGIKQNKKMFHQHQLCG
jgi:hypothetical protein